MIQLRLRQISSNSPGDILQFSYENFKMEEHFDVVTDEDINIPVNKMMSQKK